MLQCSVRRLSLVCRLCRVYIVAKRCVLEQKLLLTAYRKSYMRNRSVPKWINWPLFCLKVVSRSCQPLHHIQRWLTRKLLEIQVWFQRTTNRKWHMGYQMVTWPMTSRDHESLNSWLVTPKHLEHNISKTAGDRLRSKWPPIGNGLWGIKWLRHVTPKGAVRQYDQLS